MKTLFATLLICALALATPAFARTDKSVTTTGTIATVTAKSITLSVSQNNQSSQETYKISKRTVVKLNGTVSTVDKLSAGQNASVVTSSDKSKSAKEIDITTAAPAAKAS